MNISATQTIPADSRLRAFQTSGYFVTLATLGLTTAALGPTLPGLAQHTHSQLSAISFLFAARSFGYMLGSIPGGKVYDRLPGHPLMVGLLVGLAVLIALVPIIPLIWLLAAVILLVGIAEGVLDVGCNALLSWLHRDNMGPVMNGLHFFFGLGAFFSPIIVAQAMLRTGDIYWAYWCLALLLLPPALLLIRLPSPARQTPAQAAANGRINPWLVGLGMAAMFMYVGAEAGYGGWIYTYAVTSGLANVTTAAYLTSAFWGAFTLARLAGVPLAARFKPASILLVDLLGCLASLSLLLLFPSSTPAVWVGTIGTGVFMASFFPTLLSFAGENMVITGQVTGWFLGAAGAGGMFLPWLIGQMIDPLGPQAAMWAILLDTAAALLVLAVLVAYTRNILHHRV